MEAMRKLTTEGGIRGGKRELRDACCVRCCGQSSHLILMELASVADSVNVLLIHVGTAGWTGPEQIRPSVFQQRRKSNKGGEMKPTHRRRCSLQLMLQMCCFCLTAGLWR